MSSKIIFIYQDMFIYHMYSWVRNWRGGLLTVSTYKRKVGFCHVQLQLIFPKLMLSFQVD